MPWLVRYPYPFECNMKGLGSIQQRECEQTSTDSIALKCVQSDLFEL